MVTKVQYIALHSLEAFLGSLRPLTNKNLPPHPKKNSASEGFHTSTKTFLCLGIKLELSLLAHPADFGNVILNAY